MAIVSMLPLSVLAASDKELLPCLEISLKRGSGEPIAVSATVDKEFRLASVSAGFNMKQIQVSKEMLEGTEFADLQGLKIVGGVFANEVAGQRDSPSTTDRSKASRTRYFKVIFEIGDSRKFFTGVDSGSGILELRKTVEFFFHEDRFVRRVIVEYLPNGNKHSEKITEWEGHKDPR